MSNSLLPFTTERLLQILRSQLHSDSYLVAYSGGADSTALLYALAQLGSQLESQVKAVHINHGIHPDAELWQEHCEKFCSHVDIPLTCLSISLNHSSGSGLEAEARQRRYHAMSSLLETGGCLLTAHHADDQAETLLLNLMRGSGVDGLSAMPRSRPLGAGTLRRPLLDFERAELINYLQENDIPWLEDPSNQVLSHDRNFVRHQVIPLLEGRWHGVSKRMLLTHNAMIEARSLLERLADEYLEQYARHTSVLQVAVQLNSDPGLFKLVIRRWLKESGLPSIPAGSLEALYEQVAHTSNDQKIRIQWSGWLLYLYQNQLWLTRADDLQRCPSVKWPAGQQGIDLGTHCGTLKLEGAATNGPPGELLVCNRQNCNIKTIRQGSLHKSLKNIFQMAGIPVWLRDAVPLCILDGKLAAMGDWCYADNFASWMQENNVELVWRPKNELLQFVVGQQHLAGFSASKY